MRSVTRFAALAYLRGGSVVESRFRDEDLETTREEEATSDETLAEIEEEEKSEDTSDSQRIPAPDSSSGPQPARDDEGLM